MSVRPFEAFEAERDSELDTVMGAVTEAHPHLNVHGFFELADTLIGNETEEGDVEIIARETLNRRRFAPTLNRQIMSFLSDPRRLINDVSVARYAHDFFASSAEHRIDYPIAAAYAGAIGTTLGEVLLETDYKDLPPSASDEWFSALDTAEEPKVAADIMHTSGVLQRTLIRVVHQDPIRFIDRLHALGLRGLRPEDDLGTATTVKIMRDVLQSDAMAASSLFQGAYLLEDPKKAGMQQRAMDLMLSLDKLLGVRIASYYSRERYNDELESTDRHLLERHLLPTTAGGRVDTKAWRSRPPEHGAREEVDFIIKAGMQEGRDTIYGRIVHYKRRNSLLGRLFRRGGDKE